jgi:phosphohistidine phosphatase
MAGLELYLVRHGLAEERGADYPDDSERPLTTDGIAQLKRAAKALNARDVRIDHRHTSPLVRTRQTAEILAEHLASRPPVSNADALAPGGSAAAVIAAVIHELASHAGKGRLAAVGHEPDIGELAARLIGSRTAIPFKKGAICRIDFEALPPKGAGQLRWFATPKMLRRMC